MDGKLLILCDERPTIDKNGRWIDKERGLPLTNRYNKWTNYINEEVEFDEHKKIITIMDLLDEYTTESTKSDKLFVDWKTMIPNDVEELYELVKYASSSQIIPYEKISSWLLKSDNLMKKAHVDRLITINNEGRRPSIDYKFQAMDDFLVLFSNIIKENGIVSILPALSVKEYVDVNNSRLKLLETYKYRNDTMSTDGKEPKVDVLPPMQYETFGEVYNRANDEMMKILSKPDWYEKSTEEDEPGGRN